LFTDDSRNTGNITRSRALTAMLEVTFGINYVWEVSMITNNITARNKRQYEM